MQVSLLSISQHAFVQVLFEFKIWIGVQAVGRAHLKLGLFQQFNPIVY